MVSQLTYHADIVIRIIQLSYRFNLLESESRGLFMGSPCASARLQVGHHQGYLSFRFDLTVPESGVLFRY